MVKYEPTLRSVITPNDQFIRRVFEAARAYFIDIYQREYKWTIENVKTLLNDIEVQFGMHQRTKTNPKEIQVEVQECFEPYFLNTIAFMSFLLTCFDLVTSACKAWPSTCP